MKHLGSALERMYGTEGYEVRCEPDKEPYIAVWDLDEPQPTREELEAAWLEVHREANREKLDEGGRERLKQLGAKNLEEASIAAIGMSDELNRYEMSEARRAELEAKLDQMQSIRQQWNDLIAANEAAQTHAQLDEVRWQ